MAEISDKEFERLAVLHAMGALDEEETERFRQAREERGRRGDRLVRGVQHAFGGVGGPPVAAGERADLAAVTGRPLRSRRPWAWILVSVLLALAFMGALGWGVWLQGRASDLGADGRAAADRADSLAAALADRESALANRPAVSELAPLLAAPELAVVSLAGPGGGGRLLATDDGALLVARGLPPLEEGAYVLWTVDAAGVERVAPLGRAPDGLLFARFSDRLFLEGVSLIRLTAEADTEAGAPSGPVLLEGQVPAVAR